MRHHLFLVSVAAGLLAACSGPTAETTTAPAATSTIPDAATPAAAPAKPVVPEEVLQDEQTTYAFSQRARPEKFRVRLLGRTALTANVHFSIVGADGDTLWSERFAAANLLSGHEQEPQTDASREAIIKRRLAEFLDEKNFVKPAISPQSTFSAKQSSSRPVWDEAKQRQAPGFRYLLGEEDGRVLAYSARLGKVVLVFNCC